MKNTVLKALVAIMFAAFAILSMGTDGCETSTAVGLTAEDSFFARMGTDGKLIPVDKAVFQRGEDVYFVFVNVANFKKGDDGLNSFDMDIEIKGPQDDIILSEVGILGEEGHVDLPDNTIPNPYGVFFTTNELESGSYKFKLTIYDELGVGTISKSAPFTLE